MKKDAPSTERFPSRSSISSCKKIRTTMLQLLKTFVCILLLILILPLLWLLIKLGGWFIAWLFGCLSGSGILLAGGDILGIVFIVACVAFVIWCIAS